MVRKHMRIGRALLLCADTSLSRRRIRKVDARWVGVVESTTAINSQGLFSLIMPY